MEEEFTRLRAFEELPVSIREVLNDQNDKPTIAEAYIHPDDSFRSRIDRYDIANKTIVSTYYNQGDIYQIEPGTVPYSFNKINSMLKEWILVIYPVFFKNITQKRYISVVCFY
ncbi:hypothetical protein [Peribacillus simplex]|uniref:hypothetical protein n=1 Tax=Peribacillus simplex TaxID=1478 RepID=UPI003D2794D1